MCIRDRGYCMAAASFFALAYTFVEGGRIRITLFLEKLSGAKKRFIEIWCLSIASFFSGYIAFYFVKIHNVGICLFNIIQDIS